MTAAWTGLDAFIAARRDVPFAWGEQDCSFVAADYVLAKTGRDVLADLRGTDLTVLQRLRLIQRAGGYQAAAGARLGPALPGLFARRGDVVLVPSGHRGTRVAHRAFGICVGSHILAPGANGLQWVSLTTAEAAWRV